MLLIAIVVALLQPSWMPTTFWLPALFVIGTGAPLILVGRELQRRPSAWALGAASALAGIIVITTLSVTIFGPPAARLALSRYAGARGFLLRSVGSAWHLVDHVMPTPGYVLLVVLVGTCLVLARHARGARLALGRSAAVEYRKGWALACMYAVGGVPLFFMLAEAQYSHWLEKISERSGTYDQASAYARKRLRRVQGCLFEYAAAHVTEGFPKTLEVVAPCYNPALADELFADSRLRYTTDGVDRTGRVTTFWLVAEPVSEKALWRKQYYADESGLVYYADMLGRDDSIVFHHKIPDSPLPPPRERLSVVDSPAPELMALQRCLASPDRSIAPFFPMTLEGDRCLHAPWRTLDGAIVLPVSSRFQNQTAGGAYLLDYRARRAETETTATGYVIEMRPQEYGVDGVRSYWADELGRIHWTRDDRAALPNDPIIDVCELEPSCPG
jgi:hypothetical protein